jgi:hypothetical protein
MTKGGEVPHSPAAGRWRAIADAAPELSAYLRWLDGERSKREGPRDYLFSEDRPRFEPRPEDVAQALGGLEVRIRDGGPHLVASDVAVDLPLGRVSASEARRILGAIDGTRCLLEVRWQAEVSPEIFASFLRTAFGRVVFAAQAVAALEARLAGVEIVRFPSSPYAIERPYWENMAAVAERLARLEALLEERAAFVDRLRELHVVALLGDSLESFYRPASPIADEQVAPGALYHAATRSFERPATGEVILLAGPRVNAKLLGGAGYHRALYRSLGDEAAGEGSRAFSVDDVPWGKLVTARSLRESDPAPWFCPPRPLLTAHFDVLHAELVRGVAAAKSGDHERAIASAASFHQGFVRLHPFHCANQSLAMSLVNAVLRAGGGRGIPHLLLDHFALRLSSEAYVTLFRRAVAAYETAVTARDAAARVADLGQRKRRWFALVERLGASKDDAESDAVIAADPEGARAALLVS